MTRVWVELESKRLPIISIRTQARRYRALVDTGAEFSIVSPEEALRLGLQQVGHQAIVSLMGERELLKVVQLPPVGFGSIELEPFRATVFEVSRLGLPIDLILGVNAFSKRRIQFDFIDRRIYIIQ